MKERDEIRNEMMLCNQRIEDPQVHELVTDILAQQKVLDSLSDEEDEPFISLLYLRDYPAVLDMLDQYASLDSPSDAERSNIISILRVFLGRMIEQTGRKTEQKSMDLSADMKMLNTLLGMDGLNDDLKMK